MHCTQETVKNKNKANSKVNNTFMVKQMITKYMTIGNNVIDTYGKIYIWTACFVQKISSNIYSLLKKHKNWSTDTALELYKQPDLRLRTDLFF